MTVNNEFRIMSEFYNFINDAKREIGIAKLGLENTPVLKLVPELGLIAVTGAMGIYGTYRMFKAKSASEVLRCGLFAGVGAALSAYSIYRSFTDLTTKGNDMCTSSGNRFPGWERCANLTAGMFYYLR